MENQPLMKTSPLVPSSQPRTSQLNTALKISAILTKLAMHYWRPDFTPEQMRHVMADYLEDLGHISPKAIAEACAKWRRDPEKKFFPRPGELLELIAPKSEPRCHLETYIAPPPMIAPPRGKMKSVAEILREHGYEAGTRKFEPSPDQVSA